MSYIKDPNITLITEANLFIVIMFPVQIQQLHDMEEVCYNKVLEQVKAGHQVGAPLHVWTLQNVHMFT